MCSKEDEKKRIGLFSMVSEKLTESTECLLTATEHSKDTDEEDPDTLCGLGSWTPKWLQKAANPKLFLFFYSMTGLAQGALWTYFVGCMSTMEKRFAYDTKSSGLIMISDEFAPILLGALIGHFGGVAHRPRLLSFGLCMGALSSLIMALPYFIYGAGRLDENFQRPSTRISGVNAQFCDKDFNDLKEVCSTSIAVPAVSIFIFANFIKGLSGAIYYSIGLSYIDDSIKKENSPTYLSTVFALRLLGPTVGFLLSSLCLQFYEDPFYDPGFGTRDPRWVGAWWLGFIIIAVLIFIFSIPMILFPKRLPKKKVPVSLQKKKDEVRKSPIEQLKDMGRAMKRLVKNPILISHYIGGVFRLNGIVGYYVLLPKYMEMQFKQSASKASLYSGPASIIGMQLGILMGGIAIKKCRPRPRVMTGGIVIAESFIVMSLVVCMFITCPVDQMTGISEVANPLFDLQNECNKDCMCTTKVYTPVCGPDGKSSYFSPCFAGCTGYNETGTNEVFTDCKCVHNEEGESITGNSTKGYCGFECQWMITYIVIVSLGKLLSSTARVGNALIALRCVDPGDKSIALGASSGMYSLLAFIPYPLIYGTLTDASCLVWQKSCGKTGNCWVYDTEKFRYLLHGVSAAFVFMGCVTDVFVWILSPRLRNLYDDDDENENTADEETIYEAEVINKGELLRVVKTGIMDGSLNSLKEKTHLTTPL